MKEIFLKQGFSKAPSFIDLEEVEQIKLIYDTILSDLESAAHLRSDLSSKDAVGEEKITQIICPSSIYANLKESKTYKQALELGKTFARRGHALDFDMLINTGSYTDTPTPLNQNATYWIKMPETGCKFFDCN